MLLHFAVFIHTFGNCYYLFYVYDLTCIYNYTLSTVVNAALVMHIISLGGLKRINENVSKWHLIALGLWAYFAINSNLYSSVVLAAYVGSELVLWLKDEIKLKQFSIKTFCLENKFHVIILIFWLVSHVFELTGGRSGSRVGSIGSNIIMVIGLTLAWIIKTNICFWIFAFIVIRIWIKNNGIGKDFAKKIFLAFSFTLIYLALLSIVVDSLYIKRPEVILAAYFWLLVGVTCCFANMVYQKQKSTFAVLVLIVPILLGLYNYGNTYQYTNYDGLPYHKSEAVMNDIIEQFKVAEQNDLDEMELFLPKYETDDNWPLATYDGDRFSNALYQHRVIKKKIHVTSVVPDIEKNKKLLDN